MECVTTVSIVHGHEKWRLSTKFNLEQPLYDLYFLKMKTIELQSMFRSVSRERGRRDSVWVVQQWSCCRGANRAWSNRPSQPVPAAQIAPSSPETFAEAISLHCSSVCFRFQLKPSQPADVEEGPFPAWGPASSICSALISCDSLGCGCVNAQDRNTSLCHNHPSNPTKKSYSAVDIVMQAGWHKIGMYFSKEW